MDNLGRAFTFMFEDKDWPSKIILGGVFVLLCVILIGIPFLLGYLLEVARRAYKNEEIPLPDWDDMGGKFTQGLIFFIILVIYSIPGLILSILPCLGNCLCVIYALLVALIMPYLMIRYAETRDFNIAFKFEPMVRYIRENIGDIVIVILIAIGMHILAYFGLILLIIGVFLTMFWAMLGKAYLFGKLMQKVDSAPVEIVTPEGPAQE